MRKQFLPYFTEGLALGDSMLSDPPLCFVRGFRLGNRVLIIALNQGAVADQFTLRSNLAIWCNGGVEKWTEIYRNQRAEIVERRSGRDRDWTGTTKKLQPLEVAFFEIEMESSDAR